MESAGLDYLSIINHPIKQSGDTLVFNGRVYTVILERSDLAREKPILSFSQEQFEILYSPRNRWNIQDAIIDFMRHQAKKILTREIREISEKINLPFNRLSIRHAKTRWGSCTSDGNVNLNWQLIRVDSQLREYVCIHELCHLVHMNHSKEYWELVRRFCPNYKYLRNQLKKVNPHWADQIYRVSLWQALINY